MRSEWSDDLNAERVEAWSDYEPDPPEWDDSEAPPVADLYYLNAPDPWVA